MSENENKNTNEESGGIIPLDVAEKISYGMVGMMGLMFIYETSQVGTVFWYKNRIVEISDNGKLGREIYKELDPKFFEKNADWVMGDLMPVDVERVFQDLSDDFTPDDLKKLKEFNNDFEVAKMNNPDLKKSDFVAQNPEYQNLHNKFDKSLDPTIETGKTKGTINAINKIEKVQTPTQIVKNVKVKMKNFTDFLSNTEISRFKKFRVGFKKTVTAPFKLVPGSVLLAGGVTMAMQLGTGNIDEEELALAVGGAAISEVMEYGAKMGISGTKNIAKSSATAGPKTTAQALKGTREYVKASRAVKAYKAGKDSYLAAKAAGKTTKQALKAGKDAAKLANKTAKAAKDAAKIAMKTAKATKIATTATKSAKTAGTAIKVARTAATAAKGVASGVKAMALAAGPVGLAFMAFDLTSMALDMADVCGYSKNELEQGTLDDIYQGYYDSYKEAYNSMGADWPLEAKPELKSPKDVADLQFHFMDYIDKCNLVLNEKVFDDADKKKRKRLHTFRNFMTGQTINRFISIIDDDNLDQFGLLLSIYDKSKRQKQEELRLKQIQQKQIEEQQKASYQRSNTQKLIIGSTIGLGLLYAAFA